MAIKFLRTSKVENQTVLLRPDLNCPLEDGKVTDDFRITESLPTIELLLKNQNKVIICAHLGRPKGQWRDEFSLKPVAERLADKLGLKFLATDHKVPEAHEPRLIFFTGNLMEGVHREQVKNISAKDVV